jgi:hypothetical protein
MTKCSYELFKMKVADAEDFCYIHGNCSGVINVLN